ncbi:MAG TPA: chemotaxis protein CheB [Actinomycetota bacterium]|jgi:two-component system chemotaxis response regulator CheB
MDPPEFDDGAAWEPPPKLPGAGYDVVAIVSSAGGLEALSTVLSGLPDNFPAAITIVQHLDPRHRSLMSDILSRRSGMPSKQAQEGDKLQPGTIFLAPPDYHLLVNSDGTMSLSHTALVHFVRPSGDLLFESVAASYRDRVIAVVLTGTGSDGEMGVRAVNAMGGTVIVQDPGTAAFAGMPQAAIRTGAVDFVLELQEIAPAIARLVIGGENS